jgi:hypothetical protein
MEDLDLEETTEPQVPWWQDFIDIAAYGIAAGIAVYLFTLGVLSLAHPW